MKRSEAREKVMKMIYQMDLNGSMTKDAVDDFVQSSISGNDNRKYSQAVLDNMLENKSRIDDLIDANSSSWSLERMPKTDLAIARLAVAELLFMDDIPDVVTINEAVEMANKYGTEKSGKFINGVLGSVMKSKNE